MATKKPLVLYSGSMQELGAADRLDYVKLAGDTMTGALVIDSPNFTNATLRVVPSSGTNSHAAMDLTPRGAGIAAITSYKAGSSGSTNPRWQLQLNAGGTESGANTGAGFGLVGFDDSNNGYLAFSISRTTFAPYTPQHWEAPGIGTTGYAYRTTSYDTGSGPIYVSYAVYTSPNYDLTLQGVHVSGNWAGWRMGIGSSATVDFRNNGHIYSSNGWSSASDARVKRDIKPLRAWDRFRAIQWFSYIRTDQAGGMEGPLQPTEELGVIGQMLEQLEPQMTGRHWLSEDQPDHLSVNYPQLYNLGMAALGEAMRRIEALEARLAAVEGGLE